MKPLLAFCVSYTICGFYGFVRAMPIIADGKNALSYLMKWELGLVYMIVLSWLGTSGDKRVDLAKRFWVKVRAIWEIQTRRSWNNI